MRLYPSQLGASALDLQQLCLGGNAGSLALRPKSLEVLRYLVKHAGRVVGKNELIGAVWEDATVGDESLTQCISEVRRVLGDDNKQFIRTIAKRGYVIDDPRLINGAVVTAASGARPDVAWDEGTAQGAGSSIALPNNQKLRQRWTFRGLTLAAVGAVLVIGAAAAISVSLPHFTRSFDGPWYGGITCDKLPMTPGPLVAHIAVNVYRGTASFSRPVYSPNRTKIMGAEEGTGTIDWRGAIKLTGSFALEPTDRFVWAYPFDSSYSGVIAGRTGELHGTQVFDIEGQQLIRNCSIKLSR